MVPAFSEFLKGPFPDPSVYYRKDSSYIIIAVQSLHDWCLQKGGGCH